MKFRSLKLTYKSMFGYSVAVIAVLLLAVPVLANTQPGNTLLDFSRSAPAGLTADTAQPLSKGVNISRLSPGQENWYMYSVDSIGEPWVSLALRYESEAKINSDLVNFQVFAQQQDDSWFPHSQTPADILGNGLMSPLDANGKSQIETFWTGQVENEERYFVRVFNNSPFGLDYTLEAKAEQVAAAGAETAGFAATANAVPLNARQLAWTLTAQAVENMESDQAAVWMQKAQKVGWLVTEGTNPTIIPNPAEANPQTLWDLTAEAIEGQDADRAAQWLIQADSMGWLAIPFNVPKDPNDDLPESSDDGGGEDEGGTEQVEAPAVPAPPEDVYAPINIYPNKPLDLNLEEANTGRLAPYGEHWYQVTRDDLDDELIENMKMTMFFTPIQGYLSNRVNFEIFPAGQYHIWQRGDADYMENLGVGTWVSRDEDPNTGERLWNGSMVDGDRYLIKVKNGTPEEVDYYLFPNDIENAELGNPLLHKIDGTAGQIPYAPSPPTRQGPPPEPGDSPMEAIPVETGTIIDTLEAGDEIWYSFYYHDTGDEDSLNHDFKMFLTNTPSDDVKARHADFAIYPEGQLHLWQRGTIDELSPMGTSAPSPFPTDDEKSLQVLWDGQLMADHLYFIKINNHDIGQLEYEFEIQGEQ